MTANELSTLGTWFGDISRLAKTDKYSESYPLLLTLSLYIPNTNTNCEEKQKSFSYKLGIILALHYLILNPSWHEVGHFYPFVILGLDFISRIFIKNFQTFLGVKIYINWANLIPCQAHRVLLKLLQGGAKDDHCSCFLSSCQLGLICGDCFLFLLLKGL